MGVNNKKGIRNAPSIANAAYAPYLFTEGGIPNLEQQVLAPIQDHLEFDFNINGIIERMNKNKEYVQLSQEAYNRKPDAFVLTRAIAAFGRTILSGNSAYDKFYFQNDTTALSLSAKAGRELFTSDSLACNKCHSGFAFTNHQFKNNGLYNNYNDLGRMRLTNKKEDKALFKTPSLRNVALTAPYMHNGSLTNLSQVIDHYASGGKNHFNKSDLINGFSLTNTEKQNLINFLKSLTDYELIENPKLSNPFTQKP